MFDSVTAFAIGEAVFEIMDNLVGRVCGVAPGHRPLQVCASERRIAFPASLDEVILQLLEGGVIQTSDITICFNGQGNLFIVRLALIQVAKRKEQSMIKHFCDQ